MNVVFDAANFDRNAAVLHTLILDLHPNGFLNRGQDYSRPVLRAPDEMEVELRIVFSCHWLKPSVSSGTIVNDGVGIVEYAFAPRMNPGAILAALEKPRKRGCAIWASFQTVRLQIVE
jgi:hypothetical protein